MFNAIKISMTCQGPEQASRKYFPGECASEIVFNFPFIGDQETTEFIKTHGRVMFIIRGPSGTFKHELSSLIQQRYQSFVTCSADSYFDELFVPKTRTREALKASHEYCERRVKEECEKGTHPVIVKNSHIKIWEAKPYVNIAAKYGYTVIMAITLRRYNVDAKSLESTNRKGLTEVYFMKRLKQWREYVPHYLGWFLCPDDCSFLLNKGKEVLVSLTGDGKFCNVFNAYCEKEILKHFKVKTGLFCIASHYGSVAAKSESYLSAMVQEAYGKCFSISVQGFLISKTLFLAIAVLSPEAKRLVCKPKGKRHLSARGETAETLKIDSVIDDVTTFEKIYDNSKGKTVEEIEWIPDESINLYDLSVIVLGEVENSKPITDVHEIINDFISDAANLGQILTSELLEFDNGIKYSRFRDDIWFVQSSNKIQMKTVFTGLYT